PSAKWFDGCCPTSARAPLRACGSCTPPRLRAGARTSALGRLILLRSCARRYGSRGRRRRAFPQCSTEEIEQGVAVARFEKEVRGSHSCRDFGQLDPGGYEYDRDLLLPASVQTHLLSHSRSIENRQIVVEDDHVGKRRH